MQRISSRTPYVLAIDDDLDTRELYSFLLGSVGYRVDTAANVTGAVDSLDRNVPSVVITDWRLPDGDGFTVADALHARSASRRVPIIAVTGVSMPPAMSEEARRRGFTCTLLKPVFPDDILKAVRFGVEIGIARELRRAAQRLYRYAQAVNARVTGRGELAGAGTGALDARALVERAAARSGGGVTLMLADDRARYVAAGGGVRELTGYDTQELLSLSVWDLTPLPDTSSGEGLWNSFLESGAQEGRYRLRRRDGEAVEAQYCAIANIVPGLHVSAVALASDLPASL